MRREGCGVGHCSSRKHAPTGVERPCEGDLGRVTQPPRARRTLELVEAKREIRDFLGSRRAKLTPAQVGLPDYGPRRVPGLRREEVAVLAGVSAPYYTRLERGDMHGVSESV